MSEHTKEPWEAVTECPGKCCWHIRPVAFPDPWDKINSPEMSEADARRIAACVNACAGIPTGDLERWGVSLIEKIREDEVFGIEQQRDELLAALSGVMPFLTGNYWAGEESYHAVDRALAIVRNVEAEKVGASDTVKAENNV